MKKGMIFAAGLGTRLKPMTNTKPKALVKVAGMTLLERAIKKLSTAGVSDIIINIHHFGNEILNFISSSDNLPGVNISISDEMDLLRDTGGGLKHAARFFDDDQPIVLYNVDVLSDIDLKKMLGHHEEKMALATVAVRSRDSSRYLLFDEQYHLKGWENIKTGDQKIHTGKPDDLKRQAFSGVHIIDPSLLNFMPAKEVFSIIEVYLSLASDHVIAGYNHDEDYWFDLGTSEKLAKAENFLKKQENNSYLL